MHHMLLLSFSQHDGASCFLSVRHSTRNSHSQPKHKERKKISKRFLREVFIVLFLFFPPFFFFYSSHVERKCVSEGKKEKKKKQAHTKKLLVYQSVFGMKKEKNERFWGSSTSSSFVDLFIPTN